MQNYCCTFLIDLNVYKSYLYFVKNDNFQIFKICDGNQQRRAICELNF
jgi:hypothetical protein